jgi:RNA polymerase sigma-70 factor (ECF subfamily)
MSKHAHSDGAFEVQKLFVKHSSAIRSFILSLVPDFDLADDILQEVFVVVTERADTFEIGTNFVAWARQIARNKLMSAQQKYRSSAQILSSDTIEALVVQMPDEDESDQVDVLRDCLGKLAPRAEQVTRMRYHEHRKPAEIAREIGWTAAAVYVALSRARTFLRHCVEEQTREA